MGGSLSPTFGLGISLVGCSGVPLGSVSPSLIVLRRKWLKQCLGALGFG